MTLRAMETFLHFSDCLSFSETARRMECTQPAAFAHISLMQEQLGRPLYWRDNNGLRLTAVGQRLATTLRLYREQAAAIAADIVPSGTIPPLVLAASADITQFVLVPRLPAYFAAAPHRRLHLRAFDRAYACESLLEGRTQLALLECDRAPAGLDASFVASWPYALCGPAAMLEQNPSLDPLAGLPLILPPPSSPLRQAMEAAGLRELNIRLEVPVYDLILKFVDQGLGYGVVPLYCVGHRPYRLISALPPTHLQLVERSSQPEGSRLDDFKHAIINSIKGL